MPVVEPSRREDQAAIVSLLTEAGLPVSDLDDDGAVAFLVVREGGDLIGVVGIQRLGADALLRSLAVHSAYRHRKLGRLLVESAQQHALSEDIATLHLLTTDASGYFARLGYTPVDRSDAPEGIRRSSQFAGLCPASSTLMVRRLSRLAEGG